MHHSQRCPRTHVHGHPFLPTSGEHIVLLVVWNQADLFHVIHFLVVIVLRVLVLVAPIYSAVLSLLCSVNC